MACVISYPIKVLINCQKVLCTSNYKEPVSFFALLKNVAYKTTTTCTFERRRLIINGLVDERSMWQEPVSEINSFFIGKVWFVKSNTSFLITEHLTF